MTQRAIDPTEILRTHRRGGDSPRVTVQKARAAQDSLRLAKYLELPHTRRLLAEMLHSAGLTTPGTPPELQTWAASLYHRIESVGAGTAAELLAEHAKAIARERAEDVAREQSMTVT